MTRGLFRIRTGDGRIRVARGDVDAGPAEILAADVTIASLLRAGRDGLSSALGASNEGAVGTGWTLLAPLDSQEVWAAGVTYERSRDARMDEAVEPSVYDRIYEARRPELFFKAAAWRVRASGEPIGVRVDSGWDVPEPELVLVATAGLELAGFSIGNDVSSRTIEGENPLYLPQAKVYDGACAIGPAIVPLSEASGAFDIQLVIERDGATVFDDTTSSDRLRRSFEDLLEHLGRALAFPDGVALLTGTGIVPPPEFSLTAGDVVRITIDGLGTLENRVQAVGSQPPVASP
jgi:2-dehydro-3-deoxy-D-arabinonate dehydratase